MAEPSDGSNLPDSQNIHPKNYTSKQARERFAVAKYYGMGTDGEWTAKEIANELDVGVRTVYKYIHESEVGEEVKEVLATTEAEWRLDLALNLRREVERLEEIEQELLQKKEAIPTGFENKTVRGTPTGDRNISLSEQNSEYSLVIPVPTEYETVTDYGPDLERVQKEKRNYLQQIAKLLGLDAPKKREIDETLTQRHEEVKIVEYRETDDNYPDQDVIDVDGSAAQIEETDVDNREQNYDGDDVTEGSDG